MVKSTYGMPLPLFLEYIGIDDTDNYEVLETLRMYYLDIDATRIHLLHYFLRFVENDYAVVRRKRTSCIDESLTEMYNNTKNKRRMKRMLSTMGYECGYCTDYGYFELVDIDSDIEKIIKQMDESVQFSIVKYKDRL